MAKKVEEIKEDFGFELDTITQEEDKKEVIIHSEDNERRITSHSREVASSYDDDTPMINPLRNEKVIIRFLPKPYCKVSEVKHILYGGMAEGAKRTFVVPITTTGTLVEVLSKSERAYLENIMGLEPNALSSLRKKDNFWLEGNGGISKVVLNKTDNILDLSSPEDFIRYKILLANKDFIAPSVKVMEDSPKASYQFVVVSDNEQNKLETANMSATMQCYMEFGKVSSDYDTLKFLIETLDGRPISRGTKIEFLHTKVNQLIQSDSKLFLQAIKDEYLSTKVLIKRAVEAGIIVMRGNFLYMRDGNLPLCGNNAEPTLNVAAQFLNMPKNQEMLLTIQAKLKV